VTETEIRVADDSQPRGLPSESPLLIGVVHDDPVVTPAAERRDKCNVDGGAGDKGSQWFVRAVARDVADLVLLVAALSTARLTFAR
jgi:hypothetical protein